MDTLKQKGVSLSIRGSEDPGETASPWLTVSLDTIECIKRRQRRCWDSADAYDDRNQ